MKSRKLCVIGMGVLVLLMGSFGNVMAGINPGGFSITPLIGGITWDSDWDLDDEVTYGLAAGYDFTKNWGIEGMLTYLNTTDSRDDGDVDAYIYHLDALYHFLPDQKWVPYVAAGFGGISLDREERTSKSWAAANVGGGLKYFITEAVALRGDVRYLLSFDETRHNFLYTLGLSFLFGGRKAEPVAAAPRDSDGDGVPDDLDKCPGTPFGVKVDGGGCPLDSDRDGVPDYLDRCPGTPSGVKVDSSGCPLDSDRDGVLDYLDRCPGTPGGVKVDGSGCPLDSDGDGVPDYVDRCPGTPQGAKVDEKGCPLILKEAVSIELKIQFDTNSAEIKPVYDELIRRVANFMREYPNTKAVIEGHTDDRGAAAYNQDLSRRRAESVKSYLVEKYAVSPARLTAVGYGESKPVAGNDTKEGREKNRRVVAVISAIKEEMQKK